MTLSPGDVLYHPAGIWHQVECVEDSIAINISLISASYAEVFTTALQQLLWQDPMWRAPLTHNRELALSRMQSLLQGIPRLLEDVQASDVLPMSCFDHTMLLDTKDTVSDQHSEESTDGDEDIVEDADDGGDDNVEDEEGEEEDQVEEEESVEEKIVVLGDALQASWCPPASSLEDRRVLFRCNPLATILTEKDLSLYKTNCTSKHNAPGSSTNSETTNNHTHNDHGRDGNSTDIIYYDFIVHCGFGNETLESLSRVKLRVPEEYSIMMACFLKMFNDKLIKWKNSQLFSNIASKNTQQLPLLHQSCDINENLKKKKRRLDVVSVDGKGLNQDDSLRKAKSILNFSYYDIVLARCHSDECPKSMNELLEESDGMKQVNCFVLALVLSGVVTIL